MEITIESNAILRFILVEVDNRFALKTIFVGTTVIENSEILQFANLGNLEVYFRGILPTKHQVTNFGDLKRFVLGAENRCYSYSALS